MKQTLHRTMAATGAALLIASLGLAGCERRDDATALNNPTTADSTVAQTPAPVTTPAPATTPAEARDQAAMNADQAKTDLKQAGSDIADATRNAADAAGSKVADARITTTVNAELAKDSSLSALKIDVDTDNGRVELKGSAPSETARERATQIASAVDGVKSVDNQLRVEQSGKM